MNSSVTLLSDSSVISSFCLPMSWSSRSNGPVKLSRLTWNPVTAGSAGTASVAGAEGCVTRPTLPTPAAPASVAAARRADTMRLPQLRGVLGDDLTRQLAVRLGAGRTRVERGDRRPGD